MTTRKNLPNIFLFALIIIAIASVGLRLYRLATITEPIFDEVYFPVFANHYVEGTDFYDSHPPLGKLIIAGGILFFGNEPFGWRIMNVLAGLLLLGVVYGFTYDLTKRHAAALLALFLVAIEPMALIESRVGLINIYLALFSIAGLWFFWRWRASNYARWRELAVALLFFGLATAVKWIGLGAFVAALLFFGLDLTLGKRTTPLRWWHAGLLLIIPAVYIASFIPDILRGQDIIWWHESAFDYHAGLTATHPYGSTWWSWAIMLRPVWLYYQANQGLVTGVIEIGNVVTWIVGLVALLYAVLMLPREDDAKRRRNMFLILTYLALYLPWIAISRVKFIYHYFVPVLVLLILLAIVLEEYVFRKPEYRWLGILFLTAATLFFVYFLPLLVGHPISEEWYRQRMWLKSWI